MHIANMFMVRAWTSTAQILGNCSCARDRGFSTPSVQSARTRVRLERSGIRCAHALGHGAPREHIRSIRKHGMLPQCRLAARLVLVSAAATTLGTRSHIFRYD